MAHDLLVVDDDPRLREVVRYALERDGFIVREAANGVLALEAFEARAPDLIVLDVVMPEMDGIELCRRIRARSRVPILFLSSRADEVDKVLGLELGGDDYLAKPFSTRELTSRVRAILRRTVAEAPAPEPSMVVGRVRMDAVEFRVWVDQAEVELTATEFKLLKTLMQRPEKVFSRDELMDTAYDGMVVSGRTVDSHVRRIRQKLHDASVDPIETVHGVGYRFLRQAR